ncbi:ComEC/Rec2 family competence protein [bacterium]|nr:ComEC/Rec2 family competence protein [bacterium]
MALGGSHRIVWVLVSYILAALLADLYQDFWISYDIPLLLIAILSIYAFIRAQAPWSLISLIISSFICSLLLYSKLIPYESKKKLLHPSGAVIGVVWDQSNSEIKIRLLSQNGRSIQGFLKLKIRDLQLPVSTLVQLNVKEIDGDYFGKRWFFKSHQTPLPYEGPLGLYSRLIYNSAKIRFYFKQKIHRVFLKQSSMEVFCLSALLQINHDASLSFKEGMKRIGLSHIFAVSGFHVSIFSLIILYVLSTLRFSFRNSFICLALFLFSYAMVTGFSSSIFRALIFALVLLPKEKLSQTVDRIHILSIICLMHLILFPMEIYQMAFQLSYGITFLLFLFSNSRNQSLSIKVIQFLCLQFMIYVYFLFHLKVFPLFSFIGVCFSIPLTFLLMNGIAFGVIPDFICKLWPVQFLISLENTFLEWLISFSNSLNWSIHSNFQMDVVLCVLSMMTCLSIYLFLEKRLSKKGKKSLIDDFLVHLSSIKRPLSHIEMQELEYLIYKSLAYYKSSRVDHCYAFASKWMFENFTLERKVFIELVLNSFFKEMLSHLIKSNMERSDYLNFELDLKRFEESRRLQKVMNCEDLYLFFRAYCKRNKLNLDENHLKPYLSIIFMYKKFTNLNAYDQESISAQVLFVKYLIETMFLYRSL